MNCLESFTFTKRWYLYQLDETTKQIKQEVDLTNNPTYKLSELVIPANTLNYGIFQAVYEINTTAVQLFKFSSSNSTYFFVRPSGFFVFGIENGITNVLIGSDQRFYLNASNYSMDFDGVIDPSTLNYRYYCQTIDSTNQSFGMQMIDLYTYKTDSSLTMNRNLTCFSSNGKFFLTIKIYFN